MLTRIFAGVGDHPCLLTFYNYDLFDCKTTSFTLCLFACFSKDYHNDFLVHAQL